MDNKNLVSGNNALAPKYKPYNPSVNEEFERLRKAREEKKKALAQKNLKAKVKIIISILLAFSLGVVLILRYSAVYNLQKQLLGVSTEMNNLNMENENLKVQLIKASDMQQVEQVAVLKLHMVTPDKNNIIYLNTTKDYFASNAKEATKNTNENLIARIKNLLF
jgi:cell division protein FtsL